MMTDLCGFVNVLKPVGCTSHDVVEMIRHLAGGTKTGHAGTLDPAASGVLLMMIGAATRLSKYLVDLGKQYRAEFTLGIRTDTYDNEGQVVSRSAAPAVSEADVRRELQRMTGRLEMVPPLHSAVRINGERSYKLARSGKRARPRPRTVSIDRAELVAYYPGDFPRMLVEIACSKGTYIRSFAEMLGSRLETGAYMSGLVRTAVGSFELSGASSLPAIEQGGLHRHLIPPEEGLDMPEYHVSGEQLRRARHGNKLYCDLPATDSQYYAVISDRGIVCIAEHNSDDRGVYLQPRTVFPTGDRPCT